MRSSAAAMARARRGARRDAQQGSVTWEGCTGRCPGAPTRNALCERPKSQAARVREEAEGVGADVASADGKSATRASVGTNYARRKASWRYAAAPPTANGPLHACKPRAAPKRVTHLLHTRMANLTAGGVKAAQSGSDAPPLCLKVCRFAPCQHKRSGKLFAGAVSGAGGRQEALHVSAKAAPQPKPKS